MELEVREFMAVRRQPPLKRFSYNGKSGRLIGYWVSAEAAEKSLRSFKRWTGRETEKEVHLEYPETWPLDIMQEDD